jgi:hypothetical protein
VRYLLLAPEYRSRRSGAKHWARHGGGGPTLDLAVEVAAPTDVDPQAAEVTVTDVLSPGLRVATLEHGPAELAGRRSREILPEPLRHPNVCGLVYVDAEYQGLACDAGHAQELEEEADQHRITVDEDHSIGAAMRLVLGAFAPVREGAGDENASYTPRR